MKTTRCPYCNSIVNIDDYCEYCAKPLTQKGYEEFKKASFSFDTSLDTHQHIKFDHRGEKPSFDHVQNSTQTQSTTTNNQTTFDAKKGLSVFLPFLFFIVFFLIVFLSILFGE